MALCETDRELESQRLELYQANQGKDYFFGGLEMRKRLFQESHARNCQEIEELQRICCEETDRARRFKIDEWSLQRRKNPTTVSQLVTQIQDFQNKVNSSSDAREFYDPETASSSGTFHVPSELLRIPSPRGTLSRDSGLPLDTRNILGKSGNVCESLPPRFT